MKNIWKSKKILFVIVITFILTVLYIGNSIATTTNITLKGVDDSEDDYTYSNPEVGDTIRLCMQTMFKDNRNLYCVQHGRDYNGFYPYYNLGSKVDVTDPLLAYILNMYDSEKDGDYTNITNMNAIKQNMIWWYLSDSNYSNSEDAKIILDGITCGQPSDANKSKIESYIEDAEEYVTNLSNFGISINDIKLNGNNVDIKVSGNYESWNVYLNNDLETAYKTNLSSSETTLSIPITEFAGNTAYVSVTGSRKKYKASYYLLTHSFNQRLMLIDGAIQESVTSAAATTQVTLNTEVSLQKYITKVNGVSVNSRVNRKATANTTNAIWKDQITSIGTNKYDDVVIIEAGDTVTYKIHVYNNSSVEASEVNVTDTLPNCASKYSLDGGNTWIDVPENKTFIHTVEDLAGGGSTDFEVEVFFGMHSENILENKAEITSTSPNNSTTYRTVDSDYIKMEEYSVSLEKYVTEVTDINGENKVTYNVANGVYQNRGSKRYNEFAEDKNNQENYNRYKYDNRVSVEPGDIVTFKIILKNTGENAVKVTKISDVFTNMQLGTYNGMKLTYLEMEGETNPSIEQTNYLEGNGEGENNDGNKCDRYLIKFENPKLLDPNETTDITVKFRVDIAKELTNTILRRNDTIDTDKYNDMYNKAVIVEIQNRNDVSVIDSDGADNNADMDFLVNKIYEVSLEKYISKVNGEGLKDINANVSQRPVKPEHNNDNNVQTFNSWKYNNVVTVSQNDLVTYTIIVRNDNNDTSVKVSKVIDILPQGVEYISVSGDYKKTNETDKLAFETVIDELIAPGGSRTFEVTVKVNESNMSINILRNIASIDEESLSNRNSVGVKDLTGNNNTDSDYIQMRDIVISGTVWNDKALNKTQDNYNGVFDANEENKLSNITVKLYRDGETNIISSTTTDVNGKYTFALDYIKAPKNSNNNRWNDNKLYYSYYVVFEYDGITYTSTKFADVTSENLNDSNARERLNNDQFDGKVNRDRTSFNNSFNPINSTRNISYKTKNENGYIPQSIHEYNQQTMAMQSSTMLISLSNDQTLEGKLQHVNLGLRGRDIFDLELTSDVDSIKVTINNQVGVYKYSNVVRLRQEELKQDTKTTEDMANIVNDKSNNYVETQQQNIRRTDFDVNTAGTNETNYNQNQGVSDIEVTYKITVQNTSRTEGTATKVTNYYDSKYEFVGAYETLENAQNYLQELSLDNSLSKEPSTSDKYGYKTIIMPDKILKQSEKMEIYVVYTLKTPVTNTLAGLTKDNPIPTFNMAEITEYKTVATTYEDGTNNEATRGLIDKDSAPGSVNKEKVRTTENEGQNTVTNGNPTTLSYYFGGNDLSKLKYEDDTYATPTLYFAIPCDDNGTPDNEEDDNYYNRTITGVVFEDETTTNRETRIKTGNGTLEEGENPVYGATVYLIEQVGEGELRYRTTTDSDGKFEFSGFLPGKYMIKYYYGDTTNTVLLNQAKEGTNSQSYNGEDYQSTNNTGSHGAAKLNDTPNYWYIYNEEEGVSVATDITSRRNVVSNNVTKFIDEEMQVLNKMREGKNVEEAKVTYTISEGQKTITVNDIIDKTKMDAETQGMLFTVEKSFIEEEHVKQSTVFGKYIINNMNFGIAEVPVTTIDLQKHVKEFNITDSTGSNVIASMKHEDGKWKLKGDVIPSINGTSNIDVSIEEDKLQGARLEITYEITANMSTEKNFDNKSFTVPTIKGIVDYISNSLSYNESLGNNSKYWELTTYNEIKDIYAAQKWEDGTIPQGTADAEGKQYTTIVKAKSDNPLLLTTEGTGVATITVEKVLSATDSTIEEIITSTVESFEYSNLIEITGLDYGNVTPEDSTPPTEDGDNPEGTTPPTEDGDNPEDPTPPTEDGNNPEGTTPPTEDGDNPEDPTPLIPQRDRIRTPDRYIIVPGVHHDTVTSETLVIHPPTGDSSINIVYYVISIISLVILAAGVIGIKKFVVNTKK